jgi:hypothetical protein
MYEPLESRGTSTRRCSGIDLGDAAAETERCAVVERTQGLSSYDLDENDVVVGRRPRRRAVTCCERDQGVLARPSQARARPARPVSSANVARSGLLGTDRWRTAGSYVGEGVGDRPRRTGGGVVKARVIATSATTTPGRADVSSSV